MRTLFHSLAAAVLAVGPAFTATAAQADAWDVAKAAAETYLETKYASTGVDQVTLTKSEFGNTSNKAAGHVVVDVLFDGIFGGQLIYVPATGEIKVWGGSNKGFEGRTIFATDKCELLPRGSGKWVLGVADPIGGCKPFDTLAGSSGGPIQIGVIAAVPRSCEWTPNFRDTHSC